jgi:hypothetical protein
LRGRLAFNCCRRFLSGVAFQAEHPLAALHLVALLLPVAGVSPMETRSFLGSRRLPCMVDPSDLSLQF